MSESDGKKEKPKSFTEQYWEEYKKDVVEFAKEQLVEFDFPKQDVDTPRCYLVYETPNQSIEEAYYWVLTQFQYDLGCPEIVKITDVMSGSAHSTFYNVAQQRIGLNQDKVAQYMGIIGKMVKEMFQVVREIRIMEERREMYYKSKRMEDTEYETDDKEKEWEKTRSSASEDNFEITLKGLYVDMAEGASKNPSSVFGLAQQLQYTTLPDLFFTIHPANDDDVVKMVDPLEYNEELKWVLKRKLVSYMKWKKHTYKEIKAKYRFTVKYLRQHYMSIRTYITWVKPHLRNIAKLRDEANNSKSAELVNSFEGSLIELEFLAKALPKGNKHVYTIVSAHFMYRTMPQMNYTGEGYQRAPLHIGELKLQLRGYTWTQKQIDDYRKMREMEDLDLALEIEGSLREAMISLGEDVERYLEEAGETFHRDTFKKKEETKEKKPNLPSVLEPFSALGDAFISPFKNIKNPFIAEKKKESPEDLYNKKGSDSNLKKEQKAAKGGCGFRMWITYKNFKKSHRMITW
jgi:hypothetical protein